MEPRTKPENRWDLVDKLLDLSIAEDIGAGDATTEALVPEDAQLAACFVARSGGIISGLSVVQRLFARYDAEVVFEVIVKEGEHVHRGDTLARISGSARTILTLERLALNLLQHLSGVASITHRFSSLIEGTRAKILDTRKTLPGMRTLEKLAVYVGGGWNHRQGLYDMILIKDNHIAMTGQAGLTGSIARAITRARKASNLPIEVEVDTLDQLREALEHEPEMILLDNMNPEMLTEAVRLTQSICSDNKLRRPLLEASGGVTLETVREVADTGVDRISVGAITHSAPALDISLDFDESRDPGKNSGPIDDSTRGKDFA